MLNRTSNRTPSRTLRVALFALALAAVAPARAVPASAVVDPRPAHHAVDVTGTLGAAELNEIDLLAKDASAAGELFVAVVPSTDGAASRAWATSLFNRLHLDTGARNRGVLLMVALNDHKAEIVLGDGWPQGTSSITDGIMRDDVVTHSKAGDPKGAVIVGARSIVHKVIVPRPVALVPQTIFVPHPIAPGAHAAPPPAVHDWPSTIWLSLKVIFGFGALYTLFMRISKRNRRSAGSLGWSSSDPSSSSSSDFSFSSSSDSSSSSSSDSGGSSSGDGSSGSW